MNRNYRYLFMLFCLFMAGLSCKKKGVGEGGPPPVAGAKAVQVQLPAGASFNLSGTQLLSFGHVFTVGSDGKTQAHDFGKSPHIAYLLDKDNRPILAGFITDSTTTLSPATTAKVLLYYSHGIFYRPDTLTHIFINRIHELAPVNDWIAEFTKQWTADPLILSKGTFTTALRKTMDALKVNRNTIDIGALRTSDILVDEADFKSGIQVFEDKLGLLAFNNHYRRRAHAFLYKMKYKLLNGDEKIIIKDINSHTVADKDLPVDPASANSSVTGQLGAMIEGSEKMDQIFMAKSGPVALDLNDTESEATWKVRIVGPGVPFSQQPTSDAEIAKQTRLEVETFALDFMFPAIMETFGWKDQLGKSGIKIGDGPVEAFIDATEVFLKAVPEAYEQVKKGEYVQALGYGLLAMVANKADKQSEEVVKNVGMVGTHLLLQLTGKTPVAPIADYKAAAGKALGILKVVNSAMLGFDFIRIARGVTSSHQLEEWEVKARSSQVTLLPQESKVIPTGQQKITAEIKNLEETGGDTHPFFEWETSGKYGYLKDTKGHQGPKFESADKEVFFNCNASAASLSDGDNWEYVYVTAKMGNQVIGRDTAKINVRKFKYRMLPNGVTLSGKDKAYNELGLYLERTDGVNDIKPNAALDYKIVWTTAGKHGGLSSKDIDGAKTVTEYDDNRSWYSCTDDKTKESTETITARIYSKRKDETTYRLFDEVTGTIKINNDDKKRIIHVPMTYLKGCWAEGNCYIHPVGIFATDKDAKKYSARFYNFTGTWTTLPENGTTYSWDAGKAPPTTYSTYPDTKDISGGNYYVSFGRTWCAGPPTGCNIGSTTEWEANYKRLYGTRVLVEVTYYY